MFTEQATPGRHGAGVCDVLHLDGQPGRASCASLGVTAGSGSKTWWRLRPPFAQERRRATGASPLKTAWHDGTREPVFEPLELLERLAAMTSRPETNSWSVGRARRWRARVVAHGRVTPEPTVLTAPLAADAEGVKAPSGSRALELGIFDAPGVRD